MSVAVMPPERDVLRETLGLLREITKVRGRRRALHDVPRGNGEPVVVLPGFLTSDLATVALRRSLTRLGYDAHGWKLGTNWGDAQRLIAAVGEQVAAFGGPVRLVGWSLGGLIARGVARRQLGQVCQIITLGTPVKGGPKYTTAAGWYRRRGFDLDRIEARIAAEVASCPLTVPVTAVYTRSDRVVAWQACIDEVDEVEHIEVHTTHMGLAFAPEVHRIIGLRLAGLGGR